MSNKEDSDVLKEIERVMLRTSLTDTLIKTLFTQVGYTFLL